MGGNFAILPGIICCVGGFALLLTSFIFMILAKNNMKLISNSFVSLVSSWERDMVFDLTTTSGTSSLTGSNFYQTTWNGTWPGTIAGCWCQNSNSEYEVSRGLKPRSCNSNETLVGCDDIAATPRKDLTRWIASSEVFAIRGRGTNFISLYDKMDESGKCQSGYLQCGDPNSKSKGLCIPQAIGICPLTDITSTAKPAYKSISLGGFPIYFADAAGLNPIPDIFYAESHLCFIREHRAITGGRKPYLLLLGDYSSCKKDSLAWSVSEIGEKDFFDINGHSYSQFIEYSVSNNYKYKMLVARFLDWSPECKDIVPSLQNQAKEMKQRYTQHKILFGLYIASFCIGVISLGALGAFTFGGKSTLYKVAFMVRLCSWILIAPSTILCTASTSKMVNYFKNVTSLGCSNQENNENFELIAKDMYNKVHYRNLVMVLLSYIGIFLEVVMCFVVLKFVHSKD
jgi:hypothetical protein